MASSSLEVVSKELPPQEELTDEQMEEMLAQATTRLREKEQSKMFQMDAPQTFSFPKMDAGKMDKPYVTTKGHIAQADKARLIDDKYRQGDSLIRKVEDPVTAKKLAAEVRLQHSVPSCHVYEEDIPNFFPRAESGHRFGCPSAKMRVLFFIVTLRHFIYTTFMYTAFYLKHQLTWCSEKESNCR